MSLEMLAKVIDAATTLGLDDDIIDAVCAVAAKAIGPEARKPTEYVELARVMLLQEAAPPTVVDSHGRVAPPLAEVEQFCSAVRIVSPALLKKILDAAAPIELKPPWSAADKEPDQLEQELAALKNIDRFWATWAGGHNAAAADLAAEQRAIQGAIDASNQELRGKFDEFNASVSMATDVDPEAKGEYEYAFGPIDHINQGFDEGLEQIGFNIDESWQKTEMAIFIVRFTPKQQPEAWFQFRAKITCTVDAWEQNPADGFFVNPPSNVKFEVDVEDPSRPLTVEQKGVLDEQTSKKSGFTTACNDHCNSCGWGLDTDTYE